MYLFLLALLVLQEEYQMLVDGKDSSEYLCPVCRDRAMAHMLGELQVKSSESVHAI